MNVRQYMPEGTLNAFAKHLDRQQKMGVETLWFMPLNPISKVARKGSPGSYYAVVEMDFTSNHGKNSWNKADYGSFSGWVHAPFAIFAQTMGNRVPLIYSGQEEPVLRPLKFFDKDPMTFGKYQRAKFHQTLLALRKRNPVLAADALFRKVNVGDERAVYAYVRENADNKLVIIFDLSNKKHTISVKKKALQGRPYKLFMYTTEPLTAKPWKV